MLDRPPPRSAGIAAAVAAVAVTTGLVFALREVAPVVSLGVVYLLAVLLVASVWDLWLGIATALLSALAFNYFHLPPTGRLTIGDSENVVALVVFFIAAVVASGLAERARRRTREADERRREADLAAEMARVLLRGELGDALPAAAHRLAQALGLRSVAIALGAAEPRRAGSPSRCATTRGRSARSSCPTTLDEATLRRLRERIVPALEALLAAALERDELLAGRVEAAALRRSDTVKTALLRAVSHDLRSPLTAILTAAGPLEHGDASPEERRELAGVVREEGERLATLIDDLLDFSRIEAGAAGARPMACSLSEVVDAALSELRLGGDAVRVEVSAELPELHVDAVQLQRALVNLIANARQHSAGHAVLVRAGISRGRALVRIVDRGPGVPDAQQERIFEPFHQAGDPREGRRGSGLGLAIARGFVEASGGRVWVESLPHQGTTFVVELPLESSGSRPGMSERPRVLVLDDEPQILRALRAVLRDAGYEALPAATAEEALDVAALRRPDAAILDLVLPDGDGIEVARELRSWSAMPILVLSAVGEEDEKVRALEAGADDYVTKPFGPRELDRAPRGGAAPRAARARRAGPDLGHAGPRHPGARAAPGGRAGPPDPDRVGPARDAAAQPRPRAHPPHAARRGVGRGLPRRRPHAARAHGQPAPQAQRRERRAPAHRARRGLPLGRLSTVFM